MKDPLATRLGDHLVAVTAAERPDLWAQSEAAFRDVCPSTTNTAT
jgi:hypothetical protein